MLTAKIALRFTRWDIAPRLRSKAMRSVHFYSIKHKQLSRIEGVYTEEWQMEQG